MLTVSPPPLGLHSRRTTRVQTPLARVWSVMGEPLARVPARDPARPRPHPPPRPPASLPVTPPALPLLQVPAVGVGAVAVVHAQPPEEALLVEDESRASLLVLHAVLLSRVQGTTVGPAEERRTRQHT